MYIVTSKLSSLLFQVTYIFLPNKKMQPINSGIEEGQSMPSQTRPIIILPQGAPQKSDPCLLI